MFLRLLIACMAFSLSGVMLHATPLDPHTTTLPVYWLPAEAKADGNLAKWRGIPPAVSAEQFKLNETDTALTPNADFAPSVYLGRRRNSDDLFFLVVVKARCVQPAESAGWAFGDCMELYLDFGRGARAAADPAWWKDAGKWGNAPEMSQFGFLPQTPSEPQKIFRTPTTHDWTIDYTSMPVRGGFGYEVRVDGASVLRDLKLKELPAQIGIDFLLRAVDYPVILDGANWANHRGYVRLFGNWMTPFNPSVYGGLDSTPRDAQGDAVPALTYAALYGESPSLEALRAAVAARKLSGDELAELLYWTAFQGQMIDAALVRQLLASDSPRVREVCLQLMLDKSQDRAARKAAVALAYRHVATASPLELVCANLLQKDLGKGHGAELLRQLNQEDLTVAITAASALAVTGNRQDLAAFQQQLPALRAAYEKDPAKKPNEGALYAFMQPELEKMLFRLTPPPTPKFTPLRMLEAKNTDLPRAFAVDNNTVYNGAGLLRAWPKGGPNELWRAAIGSGWVAVTEAGGRTFAEGITDKPYAYCFDSTTGKLLWQQAIAAQKPMYCAASPLADGDRVYFSIAGTILCLKSADGSLIWREDKAYEVAMFSSPLLLGDLLLIPGSTLVAVDKLTGKERWRAQGPAVSPASPALQVVDGITQIIQAVGAADHAELRGISAKDGTLFWTYPVRGDFGLCTSPVVDGSRVYLSCGDTGKECFTALQMAVKGGSIQAYPALIRPDIQGNYAHTMSVYNGLLFGYGGNGLECDNAATGDTCWRSKTNWQHDVQLIVADGLLFIQNGKELLLAEADKRAYHELGRFTLPVAPSPQQPTLANGRLYVRGESWVVCYDVAGTKGQ